MPLALLDISPTSHLLNLSAFFFCFKFLLAKGKTPSSYPSVLYTRSVSQPLPELARVLVFGIHLSHDLYEVYIIPEFFLAQTGVVA